MTIIISTLAGTLLGGLLGLWLASDGHRLMLAAVGGVGALIAAIILAGFMVNPPLGSATVSAAAVGRALVGAILLIVLSLLLMPTSRPLSHR